MCWMTLQQRMDALAHGIIDTQQHEGGNGHSWGIAYAHNGELEIEKGVGTIPDKIDIPVVEHALVHTRFATTGEVTEVNAHPFEVVYGGETVAALAHNGTWYGAPKHDKFSDTWMMARLLEQNLKEEDADFESALQATVGTTGETVTVLRPDGTGYVYAGRFSITHDGNGVVASSGYEDLDAGLYRLSPAGEMARISEGQRQETVSAYIE